MRHGLDPHGAGHRPLYERAMGGSGAERLHGRGEHDTEAQVGVRGVPPLRRVRRLGIPHVGAGVRCRVLVVLMVLMALLPVVLVPLVLVAVVLVSVHDGRPAWCRRQPQQQREAEAPAGAPFAAPAVSIGDAARPRADA